MFIAAFFGYFHYFRTICPKVHLCFKGGKLTFIGKKEYKNKNEHENETEEEEIRH